MSTLTTDVTRTDDTLYVSNNVKLGTGSTGYILVDNGVKVVPKPTSTDGNVLKVDTASTDNLNYETNFVNGNYTIVPIHGSVDLTSTNTSYAGYNVVAIGKNFTKNVDYYSVPYICTIDRIVVITAESGWPPFSNGGEYLIVTAGYESGGIFTPFGPTNPHFTINDRSPAPIYGITHFDIGNHLSVFFSPSSMNWTWNITPGMHIGLRIVPNSQISNSYVNIMIYLKGSF